MGGASWPNVYAAQPVQASHPANWDQLFNFPGDLTLTTSIPVSNHDYTQRSPVSNSLCAYDGVSSIQLSPAPSEHALSPLFTTLSSPSTPSSTYNGFSSPASNTGLLLASVDNYTQNDVQDAKVCSLSFFLLIIC